MGQMAVRPTLGAALERGATGITVYCRSCSTSRSFTADQARANWSLDLTFAEIAARSRHRCGLVAFEAAPDWPPKPNAPQNRDVPDDWPT